MKIHSSTGLPLADNGQFLPGYDYSADSRAVREAKIAEERTAIQTAFLEVYKKTFNFSRAADIVGTNRVTVYRWAREDAEFRQLLHDARQYCLDNIEGALYDKALSGGKGSETAAIMLLNAHRAKRYRGKGGGEVGSGNVTVNLVIGPAPAAPKQLPAQTGHEITLDDDATRD